MRELFETTIDRLLSEQITPELLRACDGGTWPSDLWQAIEDSGFAVAAAAEAHGGAEASWSDLFVVLRAAGRYNLPLPLAESMLANALLSTCGLEALNAPLSVGLGESLSLSRGQVSGTLNEVPWGRHVGHVLSVIDGPEPTLVLLPTAGCRVETQQAVCGEPRDTLHFHAGQPVASAPLPVGLSADCLRLGATLLRSVQTAGALQALQDLTLQYAKDRVQFGKPIGSFQAIQHQMAQLAEQVAAVTVAAEWACCESGPAASAWAELPVICARIAAAEACGFAAAVAHTVHGAIGFTHEHALHHTTRRLWTWRSEFGNATHWSQRLGQAVCAAGAQALWPAITAGSLPADRGALA